jgi:PAS domain S-box-containing protein
MSSLTSAQKEFSSNLDSLRWHVANHLDQYRSPIVREWVRILRVELQLPTASNIPDPSFSALSYRHLDRLFRELIGAVRANDYSKIPTAMLANHFEVLDPAKGLVPLLTKVSVLGDIVRRSVVANPTVPTVPALYLLDRIWSKVSSEAMLTFVYKRQRGLQRLTQKVESSQEASNSVLDSAPIGILCTNREGIITYFNSSQESISGKSREQALGKKLYVQYAARNADELRSAFLNAINHGKTSFFKQRRYESQNGIQFFNVLLGPVRDNQGRITGAVEILQDVTDKTELEQKLVGQNRELTTKVKELEDAYNYIGKVNRQFASLIDVNNTLSTQMSLEKILDFIVRSAATMTKARLTTLRRLRGHDLVLTAQYGLSTDEARKYFIVPIDKSVIGRVILENRQILVVDLSREDLFYWQELKRDLSLKTLVCVPLRSRGRIIGVISIHLPEVRTFSNLELNFIIALANQAALAIELEHAIAPIRQAKKPVAFKPLVSPRA